MPYQASVHKNKRCLNGIDVHAIALEIVDFARIPIAIIPLNCDRLIQGEALAVVATASTASKLASRWRPMIHDRLDNGTADIRFAVAVIIADVVGGVVVDLTYDE